jgi:hypothetical protein
VLQADPDVSDEYITSIFAFNACVKSCLRISVVLNFVKCFIIINLIAIASDRLCNPVVRVPSYRFRGPGSFPRATRFSEN